MQWAPRGSPEGPHDAPEGPQRVPESAWVLRSFKILKAARRHIITGVFANHHSSFRTLHEQRHSEYHQHGARFLGECEALTGMCHPFDWRWRFLEEDKTS